MRRYDENERLGRSVCRRVRSPQSRACGAKFSTKPTTEPKLESAGPHHGHRLRPACRCGPNGHQWYGGVGQWRGEIPLDECEAQRPQRAGRRQGVHERIDGEHHLSTRCRGREAYAACGAKGGNQRNHCPASASAAASPSDASPSAKAPQLKVDTIKMVAATCAE